jgi:multiple sugar transport system permease protein
MRLPNARRGANTRLGPPRQRAGVATPRSWSRFAGLAVLWVGGLLMVIPFVWMVISSFKSAAEILSLPPTFFPKDPTLQNYREILTKHSFGRYLMNSILVTTASAASIVITSAVLGFAFAKIKFVGREVIFAAFLATMALPFEVLAIPLLTIFQSMGAVDKLWGLVVPFMFDPFAIYICRQYMAAIPNDYLDAARVEGLGDFRIFWHIVLPMSRPAIAAVAILSFIYNWDQLFWPLVLITSDQNKTVPLGIVDLSTQFGPIYDLTMAASTLTVVPILVVFFIFRRRFVEGMMMQGLKG